MEISVIKAESGLSAGAALRGIFEARQQGLAAAVPAEQLAFMQGLALCTPAACGAQEGCYIFKERLTEQGVAPLADRLLALVLILLLLPLLLLIAAAILIFDGAPVLFRQRRSGFRNNGFTILKFRTMVVRSEQLHRRMQRRWGEKGRLFKMTNDPRVTRLGGFLRATFLDELPQLFNVLRGEMRLIGARPLPASDGHHYKMECHALRLQGLPGITGLWQVCGRNALTFDQMCLLDYYYCCNRSWKLDLLIVLKTIQLLLRANSC